jgi:hypothetical protein
MIQFTTRGVEVMGSAAELSEAHQQFERRRLLHLPGLLSPEVADIVRRGMERDGFEEPELAGGAGEKSVYRGAYQGGKVGQDLCKGEAADLIENRTNDSRLLQFVQTITGSPPLTKCIGRDFRLFPMAEDLPWHTDAEGGRLADLIIHLSPVQHEGARFEMRDAHTREIFNTVDKMEFGDGLLIRISPHIEHHYKAVTGTVPKVTFSGWFVPKL